jgi:hypothetical protein
MDKYTALYLIWMIEDAIEREADQGEENVAPSFREARREAMKYLIGVGEDVLHVAYPEADPEAYRQMQYADAEINC